MLDLSIVIVSHQSKNDLDVLLPSVFESEGVEFSADNSARYKAEIIVIDSGSSDGTAEFAEKFIISYINNGRYLNSMVIKSANKGFAAGNNLGIKQARGKYILLLNPDTKLEPNTLRIMLDFMETRPDIGISGCKLVKADGKLDLACRRRFPNPWSSFKRLFLLDNRDYNYSNVDENIEMEVDSVVGAFLLIRKLVIDKIGLLDESFFMYGEDLDWCWRCKEAGFKVWYFPKAAALHLKGQSSKLRPVKMLKDFHGAMWIFYKKHYAKKYPLIFNWIVWLAIFGRLSALAIISQFKKIQL